MEFTGWFPPGGYDTLVTRGDLDGRAFHAFWLADNRAGRRRCLHSGRDLSMDRPHR
jgi:hypothetical protein